MKKALGILIVLALMAVSVPMFADAPTFSGEFLWKGDYSSTATTAGAVRERVAFDVKVDKFNELYIQFRGENLTAGKIDTAYWNNALYNVKVTTDIGGAAGLPFGLKLTAGYFDTYFTSWAYYDQSGWAFYYGYNGWSNKLVYLGQQVGGTAQIDAAFGPVNVHVAQGLDMNNTLVGFDASFAGFGVNVAYGAYNYYANTANFAKGDLSVEASYGADLGGFKLNAAPYVRYGLGDSILTTGLNIGADVSMLHAAVGVQGDTSYSGFLRKVVVDAYVKPIDNLQAGLSAYMDLSAGTAAFQGINLNAQYAFGATKVLLGYAYCDASVSGISVFGDTTSANGLYLLVDYAF